MGETVSNDTLESMDGITITFSADDMEAYLCLRGEGDSYTVSLVKARLKEVGVAAGIMDNVIRDMIEQKKYGETIKVAEGIRPVSGVDGWYEFLFETECDDKPKILEDGSVDYSMYGDIPSVEEGATIAIYHPAQESKDGVDVFGKLLVAAKGKNMAKLSGRGFKALEDGCTYVAKYGGKITYQDGRVSIEQELYIKDDVSNTTGDITYRNDIHVRGNVLTGVTLISEKGSIIVDGYVESAVLKAKKDVILKNGMQGNDRGIIEAGGDVSGKFFERTKITAGGNVNANAIMNSFVAAGNDVIVSGRFGIIVAGEVRATHQICATIIGNTAEVENRIFAGVEGEILPKLTHCESQKKIAEGEMVKIVRALEVVDDAISKGTNPDLQKKRLQLMRAKIEKDSQINTLEKERTELLETYTKTNDAKVTIDKVVYPGTLISINGMKKILTEDEKHVEYARRGSGIIVYHIEEA